MPSDLHARGRSVHCSKILQTALISVFSLSLLGQAGVGGEQPNMGRRLWKPERIGLDEDEEYDGAEEKGSYCHILTLYLFIE